MKDCSHSANQSFQGRNSVAGTRRIQQRNDVFTQKIGLIVAEMSAIVTKFAIAALPGLLDQFAMQLGIIGIGIREKSDPACGSGASAIGGAEAMRNDP